MIKVRPHHSMSWFVVGIHSDSLHVVVFPCLRPCGWLLCVVVFDRLLRCRYRYMCRSCVFLNVAGFVGLVCLIVWCNWFAHFGRASFVGLVCSIVCRNWFAHFGRASFV